MINLKSLCCSFLCLLLVLASGCENYFGDVTPINTGRLPASNQLVIGAAFTTADSVLYLRTDRALDLLAGFPAPRGTNPNYPVIDEDDLDITLFEGTEVVASFSHIPVEARYDGSNPDESIFYTVSNNYDAPISIPLLQPGFTYTLRVDHPTLGRHDISQIMPGPVTATNPVVSDELVVDFAGAVAQSLSVSIADPQGQADFYLVRVFSQIPGDAFLRPTSLYDQDPRTEEQRIGQQLLFFSDDGFDGAAIDLSFTAGLTDSDLGERVAVVDITTISPEWHAFLASYLRYQTLRPDLNDGFVEPFQVYSNVPNGFGYFLLGNTTRFIVE